MASSSSSSSRKRPNIDCDMGMRGVWLVKVPRYLSELWEANAGSDVGRLVLGQNKTGKSDIKLLSKPGLVTALAAKNPTAAAAPHIKNVPEEHTIVFNDVMAQTMEIMQEDKTGLNEDSEVKSGKLSLLGRVVKRADCRPADNSGSYLKMKIAQIQTSMQPKKFVQKMDRAAVKFKPVSVHDEDVARIKQKKEGAKTVRADRDVVIQLLFQAFEKHQYYRLQDLQQVTQQPAGYVKEILQDIAVYNSAPPHKSMWELKPEYRNYSVQK